jgi:hypothetical protein
VQGLWRRSLVEWGRRPSDREKRLTRHPGVQTWTFSVRGPLIRPSARRRSAQDTRPYLRDPITPSHLHGNYPSTTNSLFFATSVVSKKNSIREGTSVFRKVVLAGRFSKRNSSTYMKVFNNNQTRTKNYFRKIQFVLFYFLLINKFLQVQIIVVYLTSLCINRAFFGTRGPLKRTHERVEYNVFLFDEPLKGSKSLKTFKISLTFRFDKL